MKEGSGSVQYAYQLFQGLTGPVKPASKISAELVTR